MAAPPPLISIRYIRLVVEVVVRWKLWKTGVNARHTHFLRVDGRVEISPETGRYGRVIHTALRRLLFAYDFAQFNQRVFQVLIVL